MLAPTNTAVPYQARLTLALCALAALFEGFDNQSMGVAAPRLALEFGLSAGQKGLVFSAATVGLFVGAAIGGRARECDRMRQIFDWRGCSADSC